MKKINVRIQSIDIESQKVVCLKLIEGFAGDSFIRAIQDDYLFNYFSIREVFQEFKEFYSGDYAYYEINIEKDSDNQDQFESNLERLIKFLETRIIEVDFANIDKKTEQNDRNTFFVKLETYGTAYETIEEYEALLLENNYSFLTESITYESNVSGEGSTTWILKVRADTDLERILDTSFVFLYQQKVTRVFTAARGSFIERIRREVANQTEVELQEIILSNFEKISQKIILTFHINSKTFYVSCNKIGSIMKTGWITDERTVTTSKSLKNLMKMQKRCSYIGLL